MKKKVAILTSAILSATLLLSATACKENVKDLTPEYTRTAQTKKVADLTKDHVLSDFDNLGLSVVTLTNTEQNSTTYKLFDAVNNRFVSGVEVTVYAPQPPASDALTYEEIGALTQAGTGMYYVEKTVYTRESNLTDWSDAETKTTYTIYGKNGKIAENLEGEFYSPSNSYHTAKFFEKSGKKIYLNMDGNLATENNPFGAFLEYGSSVTQLDDYFVDTNTLSGNYIVYDEDGKYLRTVNYANMLEIPQTAVLNATWSVGNRLFFQYNYELPQSAKKYDFVSYDPNGGNVQKYKLVTAYYNVKKDKIKEIDFDYYVNSEVDVLLNDELTLLSVREIKDEQIMTSALVQSFDDSGKVAVDIQKLVPGANDVTPLTDDAVLIEDDTTSYVYQGKKLVGEFLSESFRLTNVGKSCFYSYDSANETVYIYNFNGSLFEIFEDTKVIASMLDTLILQTETSILSFNTETRTTTSICSFEKGTANVLTGPSLHYFEVVQYGADKVAGTLDDTYNIYFVVPDMQNMLGLTTEARSKISISSFDGYDCMGRNYISYGGIFSISTATDTDTTVEYYNYQMRYDLK